MQQRWTHFGNPDIDGDLAVDSGLAVPAGPAIVSADAALWFSSLLKRKAHHAR